MHEWSIRKHPPLQRSRTAARQAIREIDFFTAEPPGTPFPSVNQVDLLEGYAGVTLGNWQITYGKQSEWWGPDHGGP